MKIFPGPSLRPPPLVPSANATGVSPATQATQAPREHDLAPEAPNQRAAHKTIDVVAAPNALKVDTRQRNWLSGFARLAGDIASLLSGRRVATEARAVPVAVASGDPHATAAFALMAAEPRSGSLSYRDARGVEVHAEIKTPDDARALLDVIKRGETDKSGASYGLRLQLFALAKGKISSADAFTFGTADGQPPGNMKAFLDEPSNWLPQRRAFHDRLAHGAAERAKEFAAQFNSKDPRIFALRGNSGVGKTRSIDDIESLRGAASTLKKKGGVGERAVNPDNFKKELLDELASFGLGTPTHESVHNEGSMLTRRLWKGLEEKSDSVLVDRRLGEIGDVDEILTSAQKSKKAVELYDVDASLEMSIAGILARPPGGLDPIPSFAAVSNGFREARAVREKVIMRLLDAPAGEKYRLIANLVDGTRVLVADVKDKDLLITDQHVFDQMRADPEPEIAATSARVIDDDFIARLSAPMTGRFKQILIASLELHRGQTLEAALKRHGSADAPKVDVTKLPVEPEATFAPAPVATAVKVTAGRLSRDQDAILGQAERRVKDHVQRASVDRAPRSFPATVAALKDPGVDWGISGMVTIARERLAVVPTLKAAKLAISEAEAALAESGAADHPGARARLEQMRSQVDAAIKDLDDKLARIEHTQLGSLFMVERRYAEAGMTPNLGVSADDIRQIFRKPDYGP